MLIERIKYWIKGFKPAEQKRRKCKRFCITCEYYDMCKFETL